MNKTRNVAIISVVFLLIGLVVLGSFKDYEIATKVYRGERVKDNFLGVVFAFIGVVPTFVGWSFLGASIFYLSKKKVQEKNKRRLLIAFAIVLLALSFFYFCNTILMVNANAFSVHWAIAYPVGILVISLGALLGVRLSQRNESPELLKKIVSLAIISLVALVVVALTKRLMARPRFRWVLVMDDSSLFRNWWEHGRTLKASYGSLVNDEFTSFPSGHSAYAMFALFLFPMLADYVPKLEKWRWALFLLGLLWWGLTAYSRLTVGAHYLSDVCVAGLIVIFTHEIAPILGRLVAKMRKK